MAARPGGRLHGAVGYRHPAYGQSFRPFAIGGPSRLDCHCLESDLPLLGFSHREVQLLEADYSP